jgi:hypothetical protein
MTWFLGAACTYSDVGFVAGRCPLSVALGCVLALGCGSSGDKCCLIGSGGQNGMGGGGGAGNSPTTQVTLTFGQKVNNELDLLFMIDNSSEMTSMQQKLLAQLPTFMQVLQNLPMGLPSLHLAVVSSDMGAHSDSDIGCTEVGDDGAFHYEPEGMCTATTLTVGSTYISDVNGVANFTDPLGTVLQCIALLGSSGCGFEHQLASIDRALGADGLGHAPATTGDFLRPEAYLGIVMLTNEDDASAPEDTTVFSLNGYPQNMTNPDGPLDNYRQNGGPRSPHLCQDPTSANPTAFITEPLAIPPDAQGTASAPTLDLTKCKDNDSGSSAFYPVSKFVNDIKALKSDPDGQIRVAGIIGPPTPVEIGWYPPSGGTQLAPGELWPNEMHSCGPQGGEVSPNGQFASDGSFGDPGTRLAQFLNSFSDSVTTSICDPSYAASMTAIAQEVGALIIPPCIMGQIQNDSNGNPMCSVIEHITDSQGSTTDVTVQNCAENGNASPCWTVNVDSPSCTGVSFATMDAPGVLSSSTTVTCTLCNTPGGVPGC